MKLGIFGGTFNPIHYGHLRAAEEARVKLGLDRIMFIPSGNPPLKDSALADARHRYRMTKLAIAGNRFFRISGIEYGKKNKSYTVNTIQELRRLYPKAKIYLILGIDAFIDMPDWRKPEILAGLTDFIVISRPSFRFTDLVFSPYLKADKGTLKKLDAGEIESYKTRLRSGREIIMLRLTPIGISATMIREMIKSGKGIKYLLPEKAESYIISNKLYSDMPL